MPWITPNNLTTASCNCGALAAMKLWFSLSAALLAISRVVIFKKIKKTSFILRLQTLWDLCPRHKHPIWWRIVSITWQQKKEEEELLLLIRYYLLTQGLIRVENVRSARPSATLIYFNWMATISLTWRLNESRLWRLDGSDSVPSSMVFGTMRFRRL